MLVYAAPDDLADWIGADDLPDDSEGERLIKYASRLVRKATRCDRYEVDPTGLPVDLDVLHPMRDATCIQVAAWVAAGIDPAGGVAGREIGIASQSADGGSVSYADSVTADEVRETVERLTPAALDVLRENKLASGRPTVLGQRW
jgi:hypothetical protein